MPRQIRTSWIMVLAALAACAGPGQIDAPLRDVTGGVGGHAGAGGVPAPVGGATVAGSGGTTNVERPTPEPEQPPASVDGGAPAPAIDAALPATPSGPPTAPPQALTPGQKVVLEFPALPPSLEVLQKHLSGTAAIVRASFHLPQNYEPTRWFPAFIFLLGGSGGDGTSTARCEQLTKGRDFVCINMPTFVRVAQDGSFNTGINNADHQANWDAFDAILGVIGARVPNIDWADTALGGFSNGANATAAVMNRPAFEIGRYARLFYLIESGYGWNRMDVFPAKARAYLLEGDTGDQRLLPVWERAQKLIPTQVERQLMKDTGHLFPSAYDDDLLAWVQRQVRS